MHAGWAIKSPGLRGGLGSKQLLRNGLCENEDFGLDYQEVGNSAALYVLAWGD